MEEERKEEVTEEVKEEAAEVVEEKAEEAPAVVEEPVVETPNEEVSVEEEKKEELEDTQVIRKQEEPKKKNKGVKAIVIILILILLAVLGYAAYLNFFAAKKTVKSTKTEVQSDYRLSGNGLEDFDLYFMKQENKLTNKVYSPLSIKYALEMLAEGAKGETKTQLDSILGEYKSKSYPNSQNMSFANAMFVRNTFKDMVKEDYINDLKEKYNAEVQFADFNSAKPINDWVSNKTLNLINNLFSDDAISQNNFVLLNALAIDMYWNNQIDCIQGSLERVPCLNGYEGYHVVYDHEKISDEDIEYKVSNPVYMSEQDFPGIEFNGTKNIKTGRILADFNRYDAVKTIGEDKIRSEVGEAYKKWLETDQAKELIKYGYAEPDVNKYLDQYIKELDANNGKEKSSTDFYLYEDDNVKSFAKDLKEYDGITLQYVGIMPKNEDLKDYIDNVQANDINNIIDNLKNMKKEEFKDGVATIITGNIPFFKFDYQLQLKEDLQKLGVEDVFTDGKADLSGFLNDESKTGVYVSHKATIDFSNEGIKAAAVTAVEGGSTSGEGFNYLYKIPVEKIDLTFDKPYMYIIRDKDSGEVWFAGTVYEPIKK